MYSGFYLRFVTNKQLLLKMRSMIAVRMNPNIKAPGCKTKTMSLKLLKHFIELRGAAEFSDGLPLRVTPFTLHTVI